MINLRYHIVSLTAVFLAIGIGLTLGSTFLDRATVENLTGQLESLEERLGDRDSQIQDLQGGIDEAATRQAALDQEGSRLLAGRLDDVPVVVLAAAGVDEDAIEGTLDALAVAGADLRGLWWLTERFSLSSSGDVADLAAALGESSGDPARLRRVAIDALAAELRASQQAREDVPVDVDEPDAGEPAPDGEGTAVGPEPVAPEEATVPADVDEPEDDAEAGGVAGPLRTATALVDAGFVVFEAVAGGPQAPDLPAGVRVVVVGGSSAVPDDLLVQPLVQRLTRGIGNPPRTVVASVMGDGTSVSEAVATTRDDERLRSLVATVDGLDHFQGWAAAVLAIEDLAAGVVGHYGLGEGATALLPPARDP